jgi:integrase
MDAPLITIFVRHAATCKYAGDEFNKRCDCKKHLRWTQNGEQHRRKTGQRSWAGAEEVKRDLDAQLSGRTPEKRDNAGLLLSQAIESFTGNKKAQGVVRPVQSAYALLTKRLREFAEGRGHFTVTQALSADSLIAFRNTWPEHYGSSSSRAVVQKQLLHFARFCYDAGWLERIPRLSPVKVDEPDTMPLTDAEYNKVLEHATGKTKTLIKLMRWSGLAIRDASTLKRADLQVNPESGVYRVIRERTKTGTPLYIPIPKDVAEDLLQVLNGNPVYVFWDKQKVDAQDRLFASWRGQDISAAFTAAGVESAGHMVSHRLRATFAVDLLQKGLPLEHVSKLLGHRSVTTTERHYAKWVKGRQDRLDALVSATWKS